MSERERSHGVIRAGEVVGGPRLVAALSADELRLFLDGAVARPGDALHPVTWLDASEFTADRIAALNPHVLLSAWSTPPLSPAWLGAPRCALRYVCHLTGSVRKLVPRAFLERGGLVSNWGDVPAGDVAEHALLLALATLRNLPAWPVANTRLHETVRRIESLRPRSLFGRRIGLHGFGRVARALLPLVRPFGGEIAAFSAGVPEAAMRAAGVRPCGSLPELFARSEMLFECEGLTPATAGIVDENILAALPDGAAFVNIARGEIVDETALLREVVAGRLRVALDVVSGVAVAERRARFQAAGAVLSPHIAGPTLDRYAHCGELARANLARFLRGEPVQAAVTLEDYDRAT